MKKEPWSANWPGMYRPRRSRLRSLRFRFRRLGLLSKFLLLLLGVAVPVGVLLVVSGVDASIGSPGSFMKEASGGLASWA